MKFYNHITSEKGSENIISGWKGSGINDAVKNGSSSLPSIGQFKKIAPLVVTEKSNETDPTMNLTLNGSFWMIGVMKNQTVRIGKNQNDIDFERSTFDTFIINDE